MKGNQKCQDEIGSFADEFKGKIDALVSAKEGYYTIFAEWFELWKTKGDMDKICSVKPASFRFAQTEVEDQATINARKMFEELFVHNHQKENLRETEEFVQLEKDLYAMASKHKKAHEIHQHRLKATKGDDEEAEDNECQDCIKSPEKYSFNEVRKEWKILLAMQTELGELF